jgi:hypothetical protein
MKNPSHPSKSSAWLYGLGVVAAMAGAGALAQDAGKHALDYTYAEASPQYWRAIPSFTAPCCPWYGTLDHDQLLLSQWR